MAIILYAALSIVAVNIFAAVVYAYLHRGTGLAISLVGTVLVCICFTYVTLNDIPASKPAPDVTTDISAPSATQPATTAPSTVHPSLDPSAVSRDTPSPTPAETPSKRPAYTKVQPRHIREKAPVHRHHFDDREKELQTEQRGTDPGAGGCDDIAAGGCK